MSALVLKPCLTDKLVIIVDKSSPTGKMPSRLSTPTEESPVEVNTEKLLARDAAAEANHKRAIRAKQAKAEELGTKRLEMVLCKRSEKEQAALRALASRMATADEKRDMSKKMQAEKFERARFLRQAASDARAKMESALKEKAQEDVDKVGKAAAKRAALLSAIATTNAAKYARAKEIVSKVRAQYSLEEAERALNAKLAAHAAAHEDKVDRIVRSAKAHNERVRHVQRRAAAERVSAAAALDSATKRKEADVERKRLEVIAATKAKAAKQNEAAVAVVAAAATQAKEETEEAIKNYYARMQRAASNRSHVLSTPTKQARARHHTRKVEARALDLATQGLVFLDPPKRAITAKLECRLSEGDTAEARKAVALKVQRRMIGASGRVAARRSLLVSVARRSSDRVVMAAGRRAANAAALVAKVNAISARGERQVAAAKAARKELALAFAARRALVAQRQAAAKALAMDKAQREMDAVRNARGRHAKAMAARRGAGLRVALAARRVAVRRAAMDATHSAVKSTLASARRAAMLKSRVATAQKSADIKRFQK